MESQMRVHPVVKIAVCIFVTILLVLQISGVIVAANGEQKDEGSTEQTMSTVETETEQEDEKNAHIDEQVEDNNKENIIETSSTVTVSEITESKPVEYKESFPKGKYPVAEKIWNIMKSFGWSDTVCAGIMGNLMAEVGGQTLNLDWQSNTGAELGICQWMSGRKSGIISRYGSNPSCEQQVQYMHDELIGANGVRRQVTKEQYKLIINSSTPEEAAIMFAKYFERCAKYTYSVRERNAVKAYNYFCK